MTDRIPTTAKLSNKRRRFVEFYLQWWDASKACIAAGYYNPEAGSKLLRSNPLVQELVERRMAEIAMKSNEVLTRLTQQAQLNAADFVRFESVAVMDAKHKVVLDAAGLPVMHLVYAGINWEMVKDFGFLIKKIAFDRNGLPSIEFVDSQHALELIGKHRKLFIDSVDLNVQAAIKAFVSVSPDDWDDKSVP